jgi:hypothetical protein
VIGLTILALDAVVGNVLEPRLYGQRIGVSAVALLVAAAFWTFLWGPTGLVLACPLTVCVVVLGKYVPCLRPLSVLLGDEPALAEDATFYQRLSARDTEEAVTIAVAHAKANSAAQTFDALLVPALTSAARDRQRGGLDTEDMSSIQEAMRSVLHGVVAAESAAQPATHSSASETNSHESSHAAVRILGVAARDANDELALEILGQMLVGQNCELEIAGADTVSGELVEMVEKDQPAAVCIAGLPPGNRDRIRYLCKRLRQRFPELRIIVGRWGADGTARYHQKVIQKAGANHVTTTLLETRNDILAWLPALAEQEETTLNAGIRQ